MPSKDAWFGLAGIASIALVFGGAYWAEVGSTGVGLVSTFVDPGPDVTGEVAWEYRAGSLGGVPLVSNAEPPTYRIVVTFIGLRAAPAPFEYVVLLRTSDAESILIGSLARAGDGYSLDWDSQQDLRGSDVLEVALKAGSPGVWSPHTLFEVRGFADPDGSSGRARTGPVRAAWIGERGEVVLRSRGDGFTLKGRAYLPSYIDLDYCLWAVGPGLALRIEALPRPRDVEGSFKWSMDVLVGEPRDRFETLEIHIGDGCATAEETSPSGFLWMSAPVPPS